MFVSVYYVPVGEWIMELEPPGNSFTFNRMSIINEQNTKSEPIPVAPRSCVRSPLFSLVKLQNDMKIVIVLFCIDSFAR